MAAGFFALDDAVVSTAIEERHDPAVRARLSGPGLRTFLNIAGDWDLTVDQQRVLLGGPSSSTYHNWKNGRIGTLSYDQLERISLVLGITRGCACFSQTVPRDCGG